MSTNPAMVLGGLKEGVTPLEMAYAYSTIANHGKRVSGTFAASPLGPVAYTKVQRGSDVDKNKVKTKRIFSDGIGEQMRQIMHGVVLYGTGVQANVTDFAAGKTGTTENYGDAWFVGFTDKYTVAVWVGYPDRLKYMKTEFHGGPVAGGTFPAQIWHDFMTAAIALDQQRHPGQTTTTTTPSVAAPVTPVAPPAATPTTPAAPAQPTPQNNTPNNTPQQTPPQRRSSNSRRRLSSSSSAPPQGGTGGGTSPGGTPPKPKGAGN